MLILTRTLRAITIRSIQHEWVIKWDDFWLAGGADFCAFFAFISQLVDMRTHFYRTIYQLLWFSIWIITIYVLKFSIENYYRIKIAYYAINDCFVSVVKQLQRTGKKRRGWWQRLRRQQQRQLFFSNKKHILFYRDKGMRSCLFYF